MSKILSDAERPDMTPLYTGSGPTGAEARALYAYIFAVELERDELRAALADRDRRIGELVFYTQHISPCRANVLDQTTGRRFPCTCGLDAILSPTESADKPEKCCATCIHWQRENEECGAPIPFWGQGDDSTKATDGDDCEMWNIPEGKAQSDE